jgi:hypothetical protein
MTSKFANSFFLCSYERIHCIFSVFSNEHHLQCDLAADTLEWKWDRWEGAAETHSTNFERYSETFGLGGTGRIVTVSTYHFESPTTITLEHLGDPTPVALASASISAGLIDTPQSCMGYAIVAYDATWNGAPQSF